MSEAEAPKFLSPEGADGPECLVCATCGICGPTIAFLEFATHGIALFIS